MVAVGFNPRRTSALSSPRRVATLDGAGKRRSATLNMPLGLVVPALKGRPTARRRSAADSAGRIIFKRLLCG